MSIAESTDARHQWALTVKLERPTARRVLIAMVLLAATQDGYTCADVSRLIGRTRSTVEGHVKWLSQAGFITTSRIPGGSNQYTFNDGLNA